MWDIPGETVKVIALAIFDGRQWTAPAKFRRTLDMVDVIVTIEPGLGEIVIGRLADEYDADSYTARAKVAADSFGEEAYLVIGRRA